MIISPHEQNTPEWEKERLGLMTASCFGQIVNMKGERSASRTKYMYQLAGEIVSGESCAKNYYNKSMEKGHEREDESRRSYAYTRGVEVVQVGLCYRNEEKLYAGSPDGLVAEEGGWENKNAEAHVQLDRLENGWSTASHHRQVMGLLFITGRKWWDLESYSRGLQPIIKRFEIDSQFFFNLENELNYFHEDLMKLVDKHSV